MFYQLDHNVRHGILMPSNHQNVIHDDGIYYPSYDFERNHTSKRNNRCQIVLLPILICIYLSLNIYTLGILFEMNT